MEKKTVLDTPAITSSQDTDVLYTIRGTGTDRDKKITVEEHTQSFPISNQGKSIANNSETTYSSIIQGIDVIFSQGTGQTFSTTKAFIANMKVSRAVSTNFMLIDIAQMTNKIITSGTIANDGSTINYLYIYWNGEDSQAWELRVDTSLHNGTGELPVCNFISSVGYIFNPIHQEYEYRRAYRSKVNQAMARHTIASGGYIRNTHTTDQYWELDVADYHSTKIWLQVLERKSISSIEINYIIDTETKTIYREIKNDSSTNSNLNGQINHEIKLYYGGISSLVKIYIVVPVSTTFTFYYMKAKTHIRNLSFKNEFHEEVNNYLGADIQLYKVNNQDEPFVTPAGYSDDTSNYKILNVINQKVISSFPTANKDIYYDNTHISNVDSWSANNSLLVCTFNNNASAFAIINVKCHREDSTITNHDWFDVTYMIRYSTTSTNTYYVSYIIHAGEATDGNFPKLRIYQNDAAFTGQCFIYFDTKNTILTNITVNNLYEGVINFSFTAFPGAGNTQRWDYDVDSANTTSSFIVGNNLEVKNTALVDTINEKTAAAGVTIDGVLMKDNIVRVDTINEKTAAAGVTIDGVLMKDNAVNVDTINEKTAAAGVTIDGVVCKDNDIKTDEITEKTLNNGVTIEGINLKDVDIYLNANSLIKMNNQTPISYHASTPTENIVYNSLVQIAAVNGNEYALTGMIEHDGKRLVVSYILRGLTVLTFYGYDIVASANSSITIANGDTDTIDYISVAILPIITV